MERSNEGIRELIKRNGLYNHQIAEKIGLTEGYFSRIMRKELNKDRQREVINAIHELIREREEANRHDRDFNCNGYNTGNDAGSEFYNNVCSGITTGSEERGKLNMDKPLEVMIDASEISNTASAAEMKQMLQNMLITLDNIRDCIEKAVNTAIS